MAENMNTLDTSKKALPFIIAGVLILVFILGFLLVSSQKGNPSNLPITELPVYPTAKPQLFAGDNSDYFGALAVTTKLTGVQVTIDEVEVSDPNFFAYSNTPPFLVSKIPAGLHSLRAKKEGYLNSVVKTEVKKNQLTTVEITLLPNPDLTNLKKAEIKMPVVTDDYTIEYLNFTGIIQVNISNPPFEENKQKAIKWFNDQGVSDPEGQGVEFNNLTKKYVPKAD